MALALSPHLDDAAFSAGGTLALLARGGWRVVVATLFTATMPNPQNFALACQLDKGLEADVDYMALRRAEDAAACLALGAEPRWLPFPEAPHRGYDSAPALFAGLRADDGIVALLAPALRSLVAELNPALMLAPQAVGGHVDHLALVGALREAGPDLPVAWWRDYPYTIRQSRPVEPFAALFEAMPERRVALDAPARGAKLRAASAYASQLGFQFGGAVALAARLAGEREERLRAADGPAFGHLPLS